MSETGEPARSICARTEPSTHRSTEVAAHVYGRLRSACVALLATALWLLSGAGLAAQTVELDNPETGRISGRVVDAQSLLPLSGVVVQLERGADVGPEPTVLRSTVTDSSGGYRFERLRSGTYRLRVERIGYLQRVIEVDLATGGVPQVAVGLEVEPVLLPPIAITGTRPQPFASTEWNGSDDGQARTAVTRVRQRQYLAADTRQLTRSDVIEAVTLGEPDIFRALQRIPGVSTRDDFTAMIWTRGATWDQTRVFFDGLPLYNPTHAGWLFSAINPDAVGEVAFFPGHRPAEWGEGSAAVLSLKSRRGGSRGEGMHGMAELSPASARLALDGSAADGGFRWMLAGRRTYVDLLSALAERITGQDDLKIPYDFTDVVGRVDAELGGGVRLDASGILEWDRLRGDIPGLLRGNRGRWGNQAGRMGITGPLGPFEIELSGGRTRFGTEMIADRPDSVAAGDVTIPSLENSIRHDQVGLAVRPRTGDRGRWGFGVTAVSERVVYTGPFSMLGILISVIPWDQVEEPSTFIYTLDYTALWAERRWEPLPGATVLTGARVEMGDSLQNGGRVRIAPRATARVTLDDLTAVSVGWARSFQYTQDIAATGGPIGPQLHLTAVWTLAQQSSSFPVARADVSTLGVERWIGEEWLASVTGYHRRATGVVIPNPEPGEISPFRHPEAKATNTAGGVELSVRRMSGSWTGSAGYTYGDSRLRRVEGPDEPVREPLIFPSPADVRHAFDLTAARWFGKAWQLGGAFTYASGVPFTRLILADPADDDGAPPRLGAPNAGRTPSYASLDLMVNYTTTVGSWQFSAYGQLRNALGRNNAVTYSGTVDCGSVAGVRMMSGNNWPADLRCGSTASGLKDVFESGMPRLPLVGIRVAF